MKKVKSTKQRQQNGHALPSKFAKLLDPEASWDKVRNASIPWVGRVLTSDQLGDVLHWIRQVLGLACGLLWGAIPLVGAIWIALFLLLSSGIIYGYYAYVLKIDEEDFGGHGALLQEGLFASFSLFLLDHKKGLIGCSSLGFWYTVWHTFEQLGCNSNFIWNLDTKLLSYVEPRLLAFKLIRKNQQIY
ncbi:Rab5-interacting protein (Rab5ip) [Musa troglodytarum]|uniref:Rab5-interacting protein (Rab5ip) n=1 Tax=Musa troglodytarum TaxID=320322 RepID=A0A9E7I9J0_9LILI|nr:Rab5-interacting protein (Rab5ip) [Musa troglodytarum]